MASSSQPDSPGATESAAVRSPERLEAAAVSPATDLDALLPWLNDPATAFPPTDPTKSAALLDAALPPPREAFDGCSLNALVFLWHGDMTALKVDAVVNAANSGMLGGGGIDGAIHRAAGPGLLEECEAVPYVAGVGRCAPGAAVVTGGHRLPARFVVHTVGPIYAGGSEEGPYAGSPAAATLASCYTAALAAATAAGARSVAFPCISTGIFGYPYEAAAGVAAVTVRRWLEAQPDAARPRVVFVTFLRKDYEAYRAVLGAVFPRPGGLLTEPPAGGK